MIMNKKILSLVYDIKRTAVLNFLDEAYLYQAMGWWLMSQYYSKLILKKSKSILKKPIIDSLSNLE